MTPRSNSVQVMPAQKQQQQPQLSSDSEVQYSSLNGGVLSPPASQMGSKMKVTDSNGENGKISLNQEEDYSEDEDFEVIEDNSNTSFQQQKEDQGKVKPIILPPSTNALFKNMSSNVDLDFPRPDFFSPNSVFKRQYSTPVDALSSNSISSNTHQPLKDCSTLDRVAESASAEQDKLKGQDFQKMQMWAVEIMGDGAFSDEENGDFESSFQSSSHSSFPASHQPTRNAASPWNATNQAATTVPNSLLLKLQTPSTCNKNKSLSNNTADEDVKNTKNGRDPKQVIETSAKTNHPQSNTGSFNNDHVVVNARELSKNSKKQTSKHVFSSDAHSEQSEDVQARQVKRMREKMLHDRKMLLQRELLQSHLQKTQQLSLNETNSRPNPREYSAENSEVLAADAIALLRAHAVEQELDELSGEIEDLEAETLGPRVIVVNDYEDDDFEEERSLSSKYSTGQREQTCLKDSSLDPSFLALFAK
eukprot:GDKJ01046504.1.p1 GENE.GDKJ01046504.1~~GDKJ01046504.1.p1  ORF type:complete len:476 (-),score=131.86 GDKJ01046504.1:83-1510(-)